MRQYITVLYLKLLIIIEILLLNNQTQLIIFNYNNKKCLYFFQNQSIKKLNTPISLNN